MSADDDRRNAREASIFAATRGPDYSQYNQDVAKVKAEWQRRYRMRRDYVQQMREGHYQAVRRGEAEGRFREPGE